MATFKEISAADIKTSRSVLNQLVDIIQEDISGSTTRKKYQVFVTGGVGPGVTSSLFQTVYDQDYTLQTANPIFDMTFGMYSGSADVASASSGQDSAGKILFPSNSLMMREKINVYRQFCFSVMQHISLRHRLRQRSLQLQMELITLYSLHSSGYSLETRLSVRPLQ